MRTAAPLALALLALPACTSDDPQSCPGATVGRFAFAGESAAEPLPTGLDPDPALTTCAPVLGFPPRVGFGATLAADPGGTAALCREGPVLFGTRDGESWVVEVTSGGAVLGDCGSTCVASSRTVVAGEVGPDPEAPTSFQGALVEQLSRADGDCGACLPCAARYTLSGALEQP